jgi:PAS domain S-box-containing protein
MPEPRKKILQVGHFRDDEWLPDDLELRSESFDVERLESSKELDSWLENHEPSLVLIDGKNEGLESLVVAKSRIPTRPVIMVVDVQESLLLAKALEHGLDDHVTRYESWAQTRSVLDVLMSRWVGAQFEGGLSQINALAPQHRPQLQVQAFWMFFDAAPVGIKILDRQDRIHYANRRIQNMLEYSEESLRELKESDLIHEQDRDSASRSFESLIRGESDFSEVTVRHMTRRGEEIWTTLGRIGLRSADGELQYVLETVVDLSGSGRASQLVTEGGAGPPPGREFLGDLASGIAHDLRNILSLIALDSEILRDSEPDHEGLLHSLERIIDTAKRGNRIAERITQIGQPKTGQVKLELCQYLVDFHQILESMVPEGIALEMESEVESAVVDVAPSQIDRIILNLVRNAAQSMEGGGRVVVTIDREQFDEPFHVSSPAIGPGEFVVVRVSDTGEGIAEENLERIFEPYFTTKDGEQGGTGLGLANVCQATRELDGAISVESAPGEGSTFSVYLPSAGSA